MLQECGNRHHLALTRVDMDQVSRMCEDRQVGVDPSDASYVSLDGVDEPCMRETAGQAPANGRLRDHPLRQEPLLEEEVVEAVDSIEIRAAATNIQVWIGVGGAVCGLEK